MTTKHFQDQAKTLLGRLDPDGSRKKPPPRPCMVETLGIPNSGKTTLVNDLYDGFKVLKLIATRSVEGADVVPPPRVLPYYNIRTMMHAMDNALALMHDRNVHVGMFDRGPMDFAVRAELFLEDGLLTEKRCRTWQEFVLDPSIRDLFDLHVFLMCDVDTALTRKFGPDHTKTPEVYGTTTNPSTLAKLVAAHERVWGRYGGGVDPRMVWLDTSGKTSDEVKDIVLAKSLEAFAWRGDI